MFFGQLFQDSDAGSRQGPYGPRVFEVGPAVLAAVFGKEVIPVVGFPRTPEAFTVDDTAA